MKKILFLIVLALAAYGCAGEKGKEEIPEELLNELVNQTTPQQNEPGQPPSEVTPTNVPPAEVPPADVPLAEVPSADVPPEDSSNDEPIEIALDDDDDGDADSGPAKKPCPEPHGLFIDDDPKGQGDEKDADGKLSTYLQDSAQKNAAAINSFTVSSIEFNDLSGKPADEIHTGRSVLITPTLQNNVATKMEYTLIVEVRDADGITVYLQWASGQLEGGGEESESMSWIPSTSGTYNVRSFVITNLANPQALSLVTSVNVDVN